MSTRPTIQHMRLPDKVAIITGGAHGIGRAITERFSEEGAAVLTIDIDEDAGESLAADIRKQARPASFVRVDVSIESEAQRAVTMASAKNNGIDILVNNAAYLAKPWHDALSATDAEWEKAFRVNLLGAQYFTKHALNY